MTHKEWLDNEYRMWVNALNDSTVDNFKEHPMVKRMLSEDVEFKFNTDTLDISNSFIIDNIGRSNSKPVSGACVRMIYYAIMIFNINPTSIVEIGGGVGQFYVILKALGYKGEYWIIDLPEVQAFQRKYIAKASKVLGIPMTLSQRPIDNFDFLCSFYALGEFTDETKANYLPLIKKAPHGLILWNPHSGASEEIPFECTITDEYPKTSPNVKQLVW